MIICQSKGRIVMAAVSKWDSEVPSDVSIVVQKSDGTSNLRIWAPFTLNYDLKCPMY